MAGLKAIFLGSRALAFALLIACVRLGASDGLDKVSESIWSASLAFEDLDFVIVPKQAISYLAMYLFCNLQHQRPRNVQ